MALKGNQGNLHEDVRELFISTRAQNFKNIEHQFYETVGQGHGRIEARCYLIGAEKRRDLKSICM